MYFMKKSVFCVYIYSNQIRNIWLLLKYLEWQIFKVVIIHIDLFKALFVCLFVCFSLFNGCNVK